MTDAGEIIKSGAAIICDLSQRIAERLARDCCLRGIDCYGGYSAEVQTKLRDIDLTELSAQVAIGSIDTSQPTEHIRLGDEVVAWLKSLSFSASTMQRRCTKCRIPVRDLLLSSFGQGARTGKAG